jgi:hypothetical protein
VVASSDIKLVISDRESRMVMIKLLCQLPRY